jgi:hypothetical protein
MSEAKGTGDTERAVRARRPVLYEKLLRAKLAAIRDEAMELQAVFGYLSRTDQRNRSALFNEWKSEAVELAFTSVVLQAGNRVEGQSLRE